MWSISKKDGFLRLCLLIINCAICVAVIYIYLKYTGKDNVETSAENYFQSEKLTDEKCIRVCDSKACIWRANHFLRTMNLRVDPCDNFRSFLCGKFEQNFGLGESENIILESNRKQMNRLEDFLENINAEPESALAKVLTVYDSCINYGSSELRGIYDLTAFLNSLGFLNWPHLAQDFHFNYSLPVIFANFAVYANNEYIRLDHVALKSTEAETDHFEISLEGFASNTAIFPDLAVSMLKYLDLESEDIDTIIKDHELVRNSILNSYKNVKGRSEESNEDVYIECSTQNYSDWHSICEATNVLLNLMNYKDRIGAYSLTAEKRNRAFIKNLFPLLYSLPDRSVANFLALDFTYRYQNELSLYFRFSKFKSPLKLSKKLFIDQKRHCVNWVVENLRFPLVNEVMHQYLTKTVMREIVDLFYEYSSVITEIMALQRWLPPESKSELLEKIKNIQFNMDLIRQILPNETQANKVFKNFHPTTESFFNNVLLFKRSVFKYSTSSIKPLYTELIYWDTPAFDVYAYHEIALDLGFFYPPFYIPNDIKAFNFAALVDIFGHEFGHNIIHFGEELDETPHNFFDTKQCLIDQFSEFRFENLKEYLNGSRYADENFADNIGTALTAKIIEKYSYSEEVTLPGLPFSLKKLLYIISMQFWCGTKNNLKEDIHFKTVDTHAPFEHRLIAKLQNSRDFSETFQCSNKSFMNPSIKCWLFDANGEYAKQF